MAPRGALFQHLADLEQAASRERQLARQRLHQKRSGEILTTYMAFPLLAAQERMAEGMAIGGDKWKLTKPALQHHSVPTS